MYFIGSFVQSHNINISIKCIYQSVLDYKFIRKEAVCDQCPCTEQMLSDGAFGSLSVSCSEFTNSILLLELLIL